MKTPTPEEIKNARKEAGLTQAQAAALVHATQVQWSRFESGSSKMLRASWELFLIKCVAK